MIITLTGHRPQRLQGQEKEIKTWLKNILHSFGENNICISGMAAGADQLFAYAAIEENNKLWCAWPYYKKNRDYAEYLEDHADNIIFVNQDYSPDCYTVRNKFMVDQADIVLAVWDGKPWGGTYNTIKYAEQQNKTIIEYKGLKNE